MTKQVKKKLQEQTQLKFGDNMFSSRGEIIEAALSHFQQMFPQLNARKFVCSKLQIDESQLSRFISGERPIQAWQQDMIFTVTMFPIGYDELKKLNFLEQVKK